MDRDRLLRPGPIAAAAAVVALWLIAPEIFTGTFSDVGTFLSVLGLTAVVVGWVWGVRRFVSQRGFRLALIGVPLLLLAWVVLWPYVRPATRVDEAFPVAATTTSAPPASTTTTMPPTTTTSTPPDADDAVAAPTTTTSMTTTSTTTTSTTTTTVPAGPIELARGGFQGLTGHRGNGSVALYRLEDGSLLLRFEEVDIGSGPDLNVWLVPGADQRGTGGGTFVAPLTAEQGNQNYTVPADVDPTDGTWTVLVWCTTFSLEVANATLA